MKIKTLSIKEAGLRRKLIKAQFKNLRIGNILRRISK